MTKTETQTRADLIDKQLLKSGWNVKDPMQVVEEYDIQVALPEGVSERTTPYQGHQFSDYVLLGKDGKPLAVVEAKKSSKDAAIGREQAKQYCFNIQKQTGGELPFCFYTNGLETFFWDLDNYPPRRVVGFPTRDRRIYVSTYPSMLNIVRDEIQHLSPHFFDFIVIDESHRSIYNTYGEILDYFETITLGLTATPTNIIDHNTFKIFHCEDGLPTFAYTYEEAVNNVPPYLCNFQVMKIQTKFQMEGISKRTITLEDQKKLMLEGKEITEINFEGSQLEKKVINKGTNTLIVREFMEECIKDHNGVLPGKTIFFCSTKAHARRMEEVFDKLYPQDKGELAKVLVSDDSRVYGKGGLLDQFTNNDMPRIAISVGMLDTGIDVREIVNLVFAKPVYSYTRFWQMIGRGTRLLEASKAKPWCIEKDTFLILDCWDNFEYFKLEPKGKELKSQLPLPVRLVGLRLDKIEKAIYGGNHDIAEREIVKLRKQIAELPQNSVVIKEAATALHKLEEENFWISLTHQKLKFLRVEIKPLFRTVSEADFKAMRFERDVLEYSLALLSEEQEKADMLKQGIVGQISELPLSVPFVRAEEQLIRAAQTNHFWVKADEDELDKLTDKLGLLMKFREQNTGGTGPVHLDLTDSLHHKEWVEFGPQHEAVSISQYREMVESLILELTEHNGILQKIKNGQFINSKEAEELASMLHAEHPHITQDLLRQVYKNRKAHFIQFIRHILGIEILKSFPETVAEAFEHFIQQHTTLSGRQLEFLNLLKNFIVEREKVEKRDLISAPFTVIHPQGIRGVFSPSEINEILSMTERLAA